MTATKSVIRSGVLGSRERAVRVLPELIIGELLADAVSKQHYACGASGRHLDNYPGGCARRLQC